MVINFSLLSPNTLTKRTDFISNFVIVNNAPAWINFDEGRVIMDGTTVHFTETHLKDHTSTSLSTGLGNTRVVFGYKNNALAVKQVNSYYPFGMNIKGLTTRVTIEEAKHPANEYLYNGKMFQDELGLDWLDYGARMYDAVLGRWHSVDPLAEKFPWATPYSYCFNNPINSIDPDGRGPITLSILAARAAIGAAIGAGIDITVQMTANMTLGNQGFWDAASSIDWTSVGASAVTGAVGVPGANVISKTAKVATIATAVAFDAAVDINVAEGNQNIFNGEKSLSTATIDAAGSLIGGKASDDIVMGAKNSISKDISSGTYSTLNKAEKSTLRQTQAVVNSQGFEAGTNTVVKLGAEAGKQGAKSVVGTGSVPKSVVLPQVQDYTQPMDNTRVVRPVYPLL